MPSWLKGVNDINLGDKFGDGGFDSSLVSLGDGGFTHSGSELYEFGDGGFDSFRF